MNTKPFFPAVLLLLSLLTACLPPAESPSYTLEDLPEYSGEPWVTLEDNLPGFPDADKTTASFERYSQLDYYGRCGPAYANVGPETLPTQERGAIGQVKPSGWQTVRYDFVDGKYLYNRCHLIAYQLTAENANELNLITGTRYLNVSGMLPFENQVAQYVKETGNHVLYRSTPIFDGAELVARGVELEGWSVEDGGQGVCFHVYAYNVQPGVIIDYATGESRPDGEPSSPSPSGDPVPEETPSPLPGAEAEATVPSQEECLYILNTKSQKFHLPACPGVATMSQANRRDYTGGRQALLEAGYTPCGQCNP